jgi:hypothetical protein
MRLWLVLSIQRLGYGLDVRRVGVRFRVAPRSLLFLHVFHTRSEDHAALLSNRYKGAVFLEVSWPGREADTHKKVLRLGMHSAPHPPTSPKCGAYINKPQWRSLHSDWLLAGLPRVPSSSPCRVKKVHLSISS